jgi:adenine phosphoribosyltransferase
VAIASGLPYLTWPLDCDVCDGHPDPGSRIGRGEFLASGRVQGKRMLIVDDQVIDGHALASFVSRLQGKAADVVGALCLVEDAAGTGRRRVESTGVALCAVRTP